MQLFRDVIDECGFIDLGFSGQWFTWSKHFRDGHSIWERLDRGLANNSFFFFFLLFLGLRINHLWCDTSDHVPILLNLSSLDPPPRKKPFRFEEMWLFDSRCDDIVEATWKSMNDSHSDDAILTIVEKCGWDLAWWNTNCFGNVRRELIKSRHLLA